MVTRHTNSNGRKYAFCWCGRPAWDEDMKCTAGHNILNKPKAKKKIKRYSGHSKHQEDVGGFLQSGHS